MKKQISRVVSLLLSLVLVVGMLPISALATVFDYDKTVDEYYNVISKDDYEIAPGITESEIVLNNDEGSRRQVLHFMEADISNPYTKVISSYTEMNTEKYQVSDMMVQATWIEENWGWNVVGAMNTCLSWYNTDYYLKDHPELINEPLGFMMVDGVIMNDEAVGFPTVLVIHYDEKDGEVRPTDIPKVEMKTIKTEADLNGWEEQVIPCSSGFVLKDGVIQSAETHSGNDAPRSVVGIKEDGTVVIMMNDGRQSPYSAGMTMYEIAAAMKAAGCVHAVNCDGGGSSTFLSQRPGEELAVNCSPSDGALRSTTQGIVFVSTAPATGEFVRANITSDSEYYTPNSEVTFHALGTDLVGTEATIPENVSWQIKEEGMGTIADGVFTSNGTVGTVTAQMVYNGEVVGEDTIEIVIPETLTFAQSVMTVPFDKEVNIALTATIHEGIHEVVLKPSDITFTTTNDALGVIDGFKFKSVSEENAPEDLTSTLTATLIYGDGLVATTALNLGKGSEVIEDFENGIEGWSVGCVNSGGKNYDITVATATDGQVHDGSGSMRFEINGLNFDNSAGSYKQVAIYPKEDIIIKNAKSIGAWIYIPDEFYNLWIRFHYYYENADGTYTKKNTVPVFNQPSVYNQVNESGWYYFSVDVSAYKSVMLKGGTSTDAKTSRFIEFNACHMATNDIWTQLNGTLNGDYTIYVDSICADFSDAVDDREAPIFSSVALLGNESEVALENHTITKTTSNVINANAKVAEDTTKVNATGLNPVSAKAYIDGVEVDCTYNNGKIAISDIKVADGAHRIKFEICDMMGNKSVVVRVINVVSGVEASSVQVVPADATLDKLLGGSVYWMNMNATDIETIQSVSTVIDLNSSNHWELDHVEVAEGFTAEYTIAEETNTATITITRTGENNQTGKATLVSLPVRIIYYDTDINLEGYTAETYWKDYNFWSHDLKLDVDKGVITYVEGYTSDVLNTFSNEEFSVDTEWYTSGLKTDATHKTEKGTSHVHTVSQLKDKEATCTEKGYTGRTYCEVCKSVVDWGTTVVAKGHEYAVIEGKLACVNGGELFNGVYTDGKTYIDGIVASDGWNSEHTSYYKNGVKLTGSHVINKTVYTFDDNGVYLPNYTYEGFVKSEEGMMYFYTNTNYEEKYAYLSNTAYYFVDGIARDGEYTINGEKCLFEHGAYVSCSTADIMDAGWKGDNVTYIIYTDGRMILGGEGETYKYTSRAQLPWVDYKTKIRSIFIGKDVTSLGHYALADIYYASTITFEEGSRLKYIGAGAFLSIYYITEIVLPDSVETIVQNSFKMCKNLENVYLPQNITYIHKLAFVNNNNVVMDKIRLNVVEGTYAESYAVEYNIPHTKRAYEDVVVATGICGDTAVWEFYSSGKMVISGSGAMYDYANQDEAPWVEYRKQIKEIVIGKDITVVGNYAFGFAHNVEKVTFEEGSKLEKIGAVAFYYMLYVTDIEIPDSVKTIGNLAFAYCSRLTNVRVPQNATLIYPKTFNQSINVVLNVAKGTYAENYAKTNGYEYTTRALIDCIIASGTCGEAVTWEFYSSGKMVILGNGAMYDYANQDATPWVQYRKQIKEIVIGKDITVVGNYAFGFAHNVEKVTFEEGSKLEKIGAVAFYYMLYVTDIEIPDSVKIIGNLAFAYCSRLTNVRVPQNATLIYPKTFNQSINVVLNVAKGTYAENYAKTNGYEYTTRALIDCIIASGTCGEAVTWEFYSSGKMVISGSGAMYNYANQDATPWVEYRKQIKEIVIGKDITVVGHYAFAFAHNVEKVTFEEGSKLKTIGAAGFYYMLYVTKVEIPDSVTSIANLAFGYCGKLVDVTLPNNEDLFVHVNAFKNSGYKLEQ